VREERQLALFLQAGNSAVEGVIPELRSLFWVLGSWSLLGHRAHTKKVNVAVPSICVSVVLQQIAKRIKLGLDDFGPRDDLLVLVGGVGLVLRGHAVIRDFQTVSSGIVSEGLRGCKG
jgi:hypothetical protein